MTIEQQNDRALEFAQFIVEESSSLNDDLEAVTMGRFGDLTREQVERGLAIGQEMLQAKAGEYRLEINDIRQELARREAAKTA